jgi:deoxyribonuclease-4
MVRAGITPCYSRHIRVSWGYDAAADYAAEVGCEAVQVFAKSPQRWLGKPIDREAAVRFAERRAELGLGPLFTHGAYLINLGSREHTLWAKSIDALADEIARAALLRAEGVIVHIGTRYDPVDDDACARRVAEAVALASQLSGVRDGVPRVILENTAGAGSTFGGSFDELAAVLTRLDDIGVNEGGLCVDTCHAWASGIDVGSAEGWAEVMDRIDGCCGPGRIFAVHANDCKGGRGEHKDRHEWVGDGTIGYPGFEAMMCEPRLRALPALLEMPGEIPVKDVENIARLKKLRDTC